MTRLAVFVETNVPQLLSHGFFLDEAQKRMAVVALHRDSSPEFHLATGRAEFRNFAELIQLLRIDVLGHVSEAVIKRLHEKAEMLGKATVVVHDFYAGFARYAERGLSADSNTRYTNRHPQ